MVVGAVAGVRLGLMGARESRNFSLWRTAFPNGVSERRFPFALALRKCLDYPDCHNTIFCEQSSFPGQQRLRRPSRARNEIFFSFRELRGKQNLKIKLRGKLVACSFWSAGPHAKMSLILQPTDLAEILCFAVRMRSALDADSGL